MKTSKMIFKSLLISGFALALTMGATSCKKEGCTDSTATNYDSDADKDDGSCTYATSSKSFTLTSESDGLASQEGYNSSTNTYTMTSNNTYILNGIVYVNAGQTLEIEEGTVIKGKATGGATASALVIARGAKIMANGTKANPIIFTSEDDDLSLADDLGPADVGLWGGVVILGKAQVSVDGASEDAIEGIDENEPRGKFGGNDNADNSGVFKYVSIRHVGAELAPGNELQALSLGGVGSGTTIHHIDVYASSDDGIEIFGGAVDLDHISIAFAEDDGLDLDQGWIGTCDKLFVILREDNGDHCGEWDGAKPDGNPIYTKATISNATMIGSGIGSSNGNNDLGILIRDGGAVTLTNSIIYGVNGKGIEIEDKDEAGVDSYSKTKAGEATITNNVWFIGGLTTIDAASTGIIQVTVDDNGVPVGAEPTATFLSSHMVNNGNIIADPGITVSRTNDGGLNPFSPTGDAANKGAFGEGNWLSGWSSLSMLGFLSE